jgi:hypothetical protein
VRGLWIVLEKLTEVQCLRGLRDSYLDVMLRGEEDVFMKNLVWEGLELEILGDVDSATGRVRFYDKQVEEEFLREQQLRKQGEQQ